MHDIASVAICYCNDVPGCTVAALPSSLKCLSSHMLFESLANHMHAIFSMVRQ